MSSITVAVTSPNGSKRVTVLPRDTTDTLYNKVMKEFQLGSLQFSLTKDREKKQKIESSRTKTVKLAGLQHGGRIFLTPTSSTLFGQDQNGVSPTASTSSSAVSAPAAASIAPVVVVEDDLDLMLKKKDGKIPRKRDALHCQHNLNSQCVHCTPYEPFDEEYLREKQIKHMSFHSFLRMKYKDTTRGKFAPLQNMSCSIQHNKGCEHKPYPKGICSKCQPSAVTLNRQQYRHVDYIQFENPHIVDRFLQYWRETSHQRAGWLIGRYEHHPDVPLGIKAVVVAVYEPPQESSRDSLRILPDSNDEVLDEVCENLGLRRLGWIFTDLVTTGGRGDKVKHFRHMDTHFLSAEEIITAASYQLQFPNKTGMASEGAFGSKFVTVCVSGDAENNIHLDGYQVSNQCMALVKDKILVPTRDAPELGYIKESSDEQYVPDVYFSAKDEYGNEIKKPGRPLPVEYLLVDVPVGTPVEELFTMVVIQDKNKFPVENRQIEGHLQDFNAFAKYMTQFRSAEFLDSVSDLHVLLFMMTLDIVPLRAYMGPLLEAVKTKHGDSARDWTYNDYWDNVNALMQATTT